MKRIITFILLFTLCLGTALASEWQEGLGPGKPYRAVPEVDLSERLGYMVFYPSQALPAKNMCRTLSIYLPREDVRIGHGTIDLYAADKKNPVLRIAMNDADIRPMNAAELAALQWGSGTCCEIHLPRSLELGKAYYVQMSQGCFVTESGLSSPAITQRSAWSFTLSGEYGVGGITDSPANEISFDLVLGGEAASAALYSRDASVDFPRVFFDQSSHVTGHVTGDHPAWGVIFFDAEGQTIDQFEF